ncbi:erythromycin esterase [Kibdelosporangium banguiense]|uniref:Erythromycin esterase n=1 Tax=Kibdelosporangium banguiense TaxID=1365924 RepID=A0ABS4TUX0_9PSEU|nr:erythromycin esterase family protein [Kibdelosporangium banguiense]MBP2327743.1 erythromycin esterase [Kibdelosporangium banguiense]
MTTSDPNIDQAVTEWLRDNTNRLRTLDPADEDFSDLEPLREIVGDARVVSIGESTHRVHEFYQLRHRVVRFLVTQLGFGGFVMESGFAEGFAVNDWVLGGAGDLTALLHDGITYRMGRCAEMREQLEWMRAYNASHDRKVRFYGMDVPDSSASALPAVKVVLSLLDDVDTAYAQVVRTSLLPLFDYLPADRSGRAWAAPALQAYMALEPAVRFELTARIGAMVERLQAMRVVYSELADADRVDRVYRCAATARHMDAFLSAMADGATRTYQGANIRDAAMAENIEWILQREDRIIVGAANGHIQRWPFWAPPIVNDKLTMVGQHLAASLGDQMVVIATCFGGGTLWLHRPIPGGAPGHTEVFVEDVAALPDDTLDALMSGAGVPLHLLDLRQVPSTVADRFTKTTSIMNGGQPQPIDPRAAFDAVVFIDSITPWHAFPTA